LTEIASPRAGGPAPERTGRLAFFVAAGIFLSRIMGLVRQRVFSHYFGLSDAADVFSAAFRIPNFLQNLFGEGVLPAPLAGGDRESLWGHSRGILAHIEVLEDK
jgi:hypothetical protein